MSALRGDYSQPKCINTLKAAITASETALTEEITRIDVRSFMRAASGSTQGARPRSAPVGSTLAFRRSPTAALIQTNELQLRGKHVAGSPGGCDRQSFSRACRPNPGAEASRATVIHQPIGRAEASDPAAE
jgi:hypothetical protein